MNYVLTPSAVSKLRRALAKPSGDTGAALAPASAHPDRYPAPYTVRWAQSENNGQGAWVIWFPAEATYKNIQNPVLMVGTVRITAGGVMDADTLPLGWKILPNAAAGGDVWLRVDVPRGAGLDDPDWALNISATFKTQDDTPSYNPTDLYTHYGIPIAKAWTDQSGAKLVRQYVTSLVKLSVNTDKEGGDGGGGGGGEEDPTPQPFDIDDDVVVRCYAPAPCGAMLVGANYAIDGNKGDILVHVDRNLQTGVYTLTVDQTPRAESPTHHEWTLYQYQGGDVVCDCRPRVLPLIRFDDKSLDIDATNHNLQIKGFDNPTSAASSTTLAADLQAQTAVQGHVLFRNANGALEYKAIGQLLHSVSPDDVSTEFIPEAAPDTTPDGDEGKLQIKGFKAGQPADANTIADYIKGTAAIPTGGIKIVCRLVDTNGNCNLSYLPLAAIWGDGTSGGLPLPEVTYLDDVTWDPSTHQLVKHWVKKNIVTGVETPVQGAPQGKTATIATTPISSLIPQSS